MRPDRLVIVVTGGDPVSPLDVADLPRDVPVVAADSGVDHALALGLRITHAVGDFDSVSATGIAAIAGPGPRPHVERHPEAKDQSDLELAMARAVDLGADRIVVIGGHGGPRIDHLVANVVVVASDRWAGVQVEARLGRARLHVVRRHAELTGTPGDLVTLLALGAPAAGVTTSGLAYPLDDATLEAGSSLGVSNRLTGPTASVSVRTGVLLAVLPGGPD